MKWSALLIVLVVTGCSSHIPLKPLPVIYAPGQADLCKITPESKRTSDLEIFYATNRVPKGPVDNREYTNGVDKTLHVGVATVQMGKKGETWDAICKASSGKGGNPDFRLTRASEMEDRAAFYDAINRQLDASPNHEVNIYVPGFKTYFTWEVEVLAKLSHCMGRGGVMICFAWPARQSLYLYGQDVTRGRESAHYLADLIEDVAKNTKAGHINLLGYSCGAAVTTDALLQLRERHHDENAEQLANSLRIRSIIYAASDIDMTTFAREQLLKIKDVAQNVVIYISDNDAALGLASVGYGASRLGRPDVSKFTKTEQEEAAKDAQIQVIDVSDVPGPHTAGGGFGGHGYWYANDRIMTDLLVSLRWQISPELRGLYRKPPKARWYFPKDYPEKVTAAVMQLASPTTAATAPDTVSTPVSGR